MAAKFVLQNFAEQCKKDRYYRLDIIRGVSFDDEKTDPSMPFRTLIVNFSLYSKDFKTLEKIKKIPARDVFKGKQVDIKENLSIKCDVTNQIFLKPGSVWKNGSIVWEPSEFFNLSVNQSDATIVSLYTEGNPKENENENENEKRKPTKMPFIYQGSKVQFLKFPQSTINGKEIEVLIPTTEVIRYYFSGSTYFTQQLFNGALKEFVQSNVANKLFYKSSFNEVSKTVYIWLKRNCYDSDAILIARGLADPKAMSAMNHVYSSLVYAKKSFKTKDNQPIKEVCPRTNLPFTDGTDMEVLGQWLQPRDGEEEFTTFVVRAIERCDHSLPFKKIEIESVDSFESSGTNSDNKPVKRLKDGSGGVTDAPNLTEGEKPSNKIEPQELEFLMQRFSHLQDVEIEKIKKVSDKEKERFYNEEALNESNNGSTLPGDYTKDNNLQPWQNKASDAEAMPISERIASVSNAVATILNKRDDLSVKTLPVGFTDNTVPYGLYSFERPADKGSNYTWTRVAGRNRQALFLEIIKEGVGSIYLLDIEGKGTVGFSLYLLAKPSSGFNVRYSARDLMFDIASSSGAKIVPGTMKMFSYPVSLKHVITNEDSFADRIERAIDGFFDK